MSGKEEIISAMENFKRLQEKYLPKVDHKLVIDLFLRMREEPDVRPMYTVETFVQEGDSEEIRQQMMRMTGAAPQMHDRAIRPPGGPSSAGLRTVEGDPGSPKSKRGDRHLHGERRVARAFDACWQKGKPEQELLK